MATTTDFKNNVLDNQSGRTDYDPGDIRIGLATSVTDFNAGTFTEVSTTSTGYARVTISSGDDTSMPVIPSEWTPASNGMISTNVRKAFARAATNWGSITHILIFSAGAASDGSEDGRIAALPITPRTILMGQEPFFNAGAISIRINDVT